ncbi:conserved hypothetical protein [Leptospira interrogans serovar Manilae]|uniref:Uncharacterized protein n=1 Tax=Leptospira interrogans serovar Manilae TaxID=214675 RepID=A0AAQ1SQM2_LEPIR|nr:conserved hypothetical protein [Leptospira interrogans serovar Manilae]
MIFRNKSEFKLQKKLTQILIRNIPDSTKVSICDIKSNNIITDGFLNVFR